MKKLAASAALIAVACIAADIRSTAANAGPFFLPGTVPPIACPSPSSCAITIPMGTYTFTDGNGFVASWLNNIVVKIAQDAFGKKKKNYWLVDYDLYNQTEDVKRTGANYVFITFYDPNGLGLLTATLDVPRNHCRNQGHFSGDGDTQDIIHLVSSYKFTQTTLTSVLGGC